MAQIVNGQNSKYKALIQPQYHPKQTHKQNRVADRHLITTGT